MKPIITSMLQNDLYKWGMNNLITKLYQDIDVEYEFINRNKSPMPQGMADEIRHQIEMMSLLSYTTEEIEYIKETFPWCNNKFIFFLSHYQYNPDEVEVYQDENNMLSIKIKGPWYRTIFWEVPLLLIVSTLNYRMQGIEPDRNYEKVIENKAKIVRAENMHMSDFGTRRAFSPDVHRSVVKIFNNVMNNKVSFSTDTPIFSTSNVALAKEFGLMATGTTAHEWTLGHAAMFGNKLANQIAVSTWMREYPQYNMRTALIDTFGTPAFLKTLNNETLRNIRCFRQDSGDPIAIGEMILRKLEELGTTSLQSKWHGDRHTILFSDSLTIEKALNIMHHFSGKGVNTAFGIGTHLTNDVGAQPLNIVIKPTRFRVPYVNSNMEQDDDGYIAVAKLSDDNGKHSGSKQAIIRALEDMNNL